MKPDHKIEPQDWMKAEGITRLMDVLNAGVNVPKALLVGGCVRDVVLGQSAGDVDIATIHSPEEVTALLSAADIKVVPTGVDHGTVTAVIDKQGFEITTLRKDVDTDGRRAVVEFAADWAEDARRRDFTINTMLMDLEGNVFDPLGRALEDSNPPRIVFVGDPAKRIAEDYLRILRFFRFHALFGQGDMAEEALSACAEAADKIETLSRERITQEMFKLLMARTPQDVLRVMFDRDVLAQLCFDSVDLELLGRVCEGGGSLVTRLYVLSAFNPENLKSVSSLLLLPKAITRDIAAIHDVMEQGVFSDDHAVKTALYRYGRNASAQALIIQTAQGHVNAQASDLIENWEIPVFPITGDDLIAKGEIPGPTLGEKLKALEQDWVDRYFSLEDVV